MKVFVSYRRDDTGGRAGRLFDSLASKYGARNVFQDVASAAPGHDFVDGLDEAIDRSDAVLVVIGPSWLSSSDGTGGRRVDREDDFVRREVGAALSTGMPVVPVLVDGGRLPSTGELPAELAALVRRQAVTISDESWHQDVDALIRRLDGEMLAFDPPRRRRTLAVTGLGVVAAVALTVVLLARDGDDPSDGTDDELQSCPSADETWQDLQVTDTEPVQHVDTSEGVDLEIAVVGGRTRPREGGGSTILVDVEVANRTESSPGTDDEFYFGIGDINGVVVDGFDQGNPECMHTNTHAQLEPGERTIGTLGWDTEIDDPSGLPMVVKGFGGLDLVVVASATS